MGAVRTSIQWQKAKFRGLPNRRSHPPSVRAGKTKLITAKELQKHTTDDDLWLLIGGKVYDVSKYKDEHPGSDSILFDVKGIDATQEFVDVGHSGDAEETRDKLLVGDFDMSTADELPGGVAKPGETTSGESSSALMAIPVIVLVIILAIVFKIIPM